MAAAMAENQESSSEISRSGGLRADNAGKDYRKDPYYIHPSDNPGMQLVSNPLTLNNYLLWSRSMLIALKAKNKVGFVNGTCKKPDTEDADAYSQWTFVDSMVISWILNSMVKELHEAYMYSNTARDLWVELEEKFGEIDRPRIFQLKKQLTTMKQGNDSLALYSNKMKKIWEELNCLEPQPRCTCDAKEKTEEMHSSNQVMQFLMGLGDAYEGVVSNILMMDPMPPFNKIYSMVSRIEKQKDCFSLLMFLLLVLKLFQMRIGQPVRTLGEV